MRYICLLLILAAAGSAAEPKPLAESWDYSAAMRKVVSSGKGRPGVVLHIGDSITYSNAYGQWARFGAGRTAADKEVLTWMHTGKDDDSDGWFLARFDHPDGNRSHTAASGLRLNELLAGGRRGMMSLEKLLDFYKPQAVVLMLGTNDVSARRETADFRKDYMTALDLMLDRGIVPIVSTIPPHVNYRKAGQLFNDEIREIAKGKQVPLIDFEREILSRRRDDWNGTLLNKNDVHPSGEFGGTKPADAPTEKNLANSGYLLRGWLSVRKIADVKNTVFDKLPKLEPMSKIDRKNQSVRVPIARDTWLSNVGKEIDTTNGGAHRLKLKAYQEMSLFDIDVSTLKGRVVKAATLHLHLAGDEKLGRVAVGTIGAEWVEGQGSNYATEAGASTFRHRRHPDVPWTIPGSDLCAVIFGQGGTFWSHDDASVPTKDGWQLLPVHPGVIQARLAGGAYGFVMFDDTGSEWSRDGEKFSWRHFPNRFVHSREAAERVRPFLTIHLGDVDITPPPPIDTITSDSTNLPAGEALVHWNTPKDAGSGVWAFHVRINDRDVPRYLIPIPKAPGQPVTMHVRDMGFRPGEEVSFAIRTADGAGNMGEPTTTRVRVSNFNAKPLPGKAPTFPVARGELPKIGGATVAIIDELDVCDPLSGELTPKQAGDYKSANHLWSAKDKTIRLYAARGEIIGLQVAVHGTIDNLRPKLNLPGIPATAVQFGQYAHVIAGDTAVPDPIVPLTRGFSLPNGSLTGQTCGSIHVELIVPPNAPAGDTLGVLVLECNEGKLELPFILHVWDFTLPDRLSFLPEMNAYDLPGPERGYYRLAHRHRTVLNVVPYSQRGEITAGWAPGWNGNQLDFLHWGRRFGPYFDGSAFADLPRKSVPLECYYLPLHENWPSPIERHYNGSFWADEAFDDAYRKNFVSATRQFAEHSHERGWHDTLFQFFLNNKVEFKRNGWSRGSSPWLLDEPASFQDFWALRYFAQAFRDGVAAATPGQSKLIFRADISRPMWQRDALDGLLDYNVVNGDWRRYRRMVLDRQRAHGGLIVEYGSASAPGHSNMQAVGWCLDAWSHGADGVVPWSAVGTRAAWTKAESTSVLYPPRSAGGTEPMPSVRLKAFQRGQQDVEYLTLLTQLMNQPRWAVGEQVRELLGLVAKHESTGAPGEDAGVLMYEGLLPQQVWALRVRLGAELSRLKPAARNRLVELFPRQPGK